MNSILITGVSTGLGHHAATFFLHKGWRVFGSVRNANDAEDLKHEHFHKLVFDVTDADALKQAARQVREVLHEDALDVLVNNAGIAVFGPLMHLPIEQFERQLDVNVTGVLRTTQTFLPLLGAREDFHGKPGRIINISSVSGLVTVPLLGPYCSSKFALESMSDALRIELKLYNIPVSLIQPASTHSAIWSKAKEAESYTRGTVYESVEEKKQQLIEEQEKRALPTSKISEYIWRAATVQNPKPRYLVTPNNAVVRMMRLLPDRWTDAMIVRQFIKKGPETGRAVKAD